jgi:FKBP-type peptidyl-prolyl cis-trans isomerase
MKKLLLPLTFSLAIAALASAQEAKPVAPDAKPGAPAVAPLDEKTLHDRVSYFYGSDVARSFKDNGVEVDLDIFFQGLKDTLEKKPGKYTKEELDFAMNQFAQVMMAKQQKEQAEAGGKNAAEGEKFLAENGKRKGVVTTASGLQYEVIKEGDGAKPTATDTVSVHYHGTLVSGKVFDSSVERGEPVSFPVNGVIPGWTEALQLMTVGSKWKLFIPAKLAYGEHGAGQDIGPNSALIFEVQLLKIEPKK